MVRGIGGKTYYYMTTLSLLKGICQIDDENRIYSCYYQENNYWNGWLQPYLNKANVLLFIADHAETDNGLPYMKFEDEKLLHIIDFNSNLEDAEYEEIEQVDIDGETYYYFNNGIVWELKKFYNHDALYIIKDKSGRGEKSDYKTQQEIAEFLILENQGIGWDDIYRLEQGDIADFRTFSVLAIS